MGLGKSGTATARALIKSGAEVVAWDDGEAARAQAQAEGIAVADLRDQDLSRFDCLVWSPGIPHTFPKPHEVAEKARALGLEPVCDVELLARARPDARFAAITGTNGKSTTTTLLAHVLKNAGRSITVGGNLGRPALDLDALGGDGTYVLELSSYQLELCPSLKLDVGVLLNITPDHLSRHGGMDGYVAAKRRIFGMVRDGGTAVIGMDDEYCRAIHDELVAEGRLRVMPVSARNRVRQGVSAPAGVLYADCDGEGCAAIDLREVATLPGRHNWQNAAAVYAAARALSLSPGQIGTGLKTYPGLAHRQELVRVVDGISYVNDSKATNADAAEKALICYDAIYWIAGGLAKEGGIETLSPLFGRIRHAFLIGEAAEAFGKSLEGKVPFSQCGDLATALARAHDMASAEKIPGAVVLLSPACASWDQFKSFEHRGETFRQLVQALPAGKEARE